MEGFPSSVRLPESGYRQVGNTSIVKEFRASDREPTIRKSISYLRCIIADPMILGTEQPPRSDRATDAGKSLGPARAKVIVANKNAASTTSPRADVNPGSDGTLGLRE